MTKKKNFEMFSLKNGMEVILIPRKESPATTVMVTVMVGSKYETKDISGLSHFLEHMAFKGTKKRPTYLDISLELEGLGASYNAGTDQESTNYYATVANKSFDQIFDIVTDLYLNPTVSTDELEKERGVIIEEINMYEDIPMRKVMDDFMYALYGDQPAGWSVAGRKEVIKSLKREDFINYREKHYTSENTILTIAGGYPENVKEKIEEVFGLLERKPKTKLPDVVENQEKPTEHVRFKELDQTHLILGFRAFDARDERRFALGVLTTILGRGMSSRLFQKVREEMGVAYYVSAGIDLDTNSGIVMANAGVSNNKAKEAIKAIVEEFKKFKEEVVDNKELEKAKGFIVGNMFLALETSDDLADFYTNQRIKNLEIMTPEELAEKIKSVTAEDIQAVANDLFKNEGLNLALIGPFKNKSFGDILTI